MNFFASAKRGLPRTIPDGGLLHTILSCTSLLPARTFANDEDPKAAGRAKLLAAASTSVLDHPVSPVRYGNAEGLTIRQQSDEMWDDIASIKHTLHRMDQEAASSRQKLGILNQELGILNQDLASTTQRLGITEQDLNILNQDLASTTQRLGILNQDLGILNQDLGILNQDLASTTQRLGITKQGTDIAEETSGIAEETLSLVQQIQDLKRFSIGYQKVRNRFFAIYLRDQFKRAPLAPAEQKAISEGSVSMHAGDPVADAQLYKSGWRSDEEVFQSLYGLSPDQVLSYSMFSCPTLTAGHCPQNSLTPSSLQRTTER